ncbi:hypothetical protein VTP01DRAFT_212 [Rhizomucor pusillus]|uniref:uncharacterized protein n=1 Tax=Rhizomucor pusillus TaxID=4840 RepID=UPI003742B85B
MDKTDENKFSKDNTERLIRETIEATLPPDTQYQHKQVPEWTSQIIEGCLKKLKESNKNYKYVVTCVIMQRSGGGFYAGSTVYWDSAHDGSATYQYESKNLFAIVNVFALSV